MDYEEILLQAEIKAEAETFEMCGRDVMIYPCGMAWVYLPGKKNPLGKILEKLGLVNYEDYRKQYYISVSGRYNQSLTHKEYHAEILAKILTEKFDTPFYYSSRID